jgi:orotidine-5'-phosphate decarboxylase
MDAGVRWVKVGAQNIDRYWSGIIGAYDVSLFLDLKLADTRDTVEAAARRYADLGVASVSTYTSSATEAALRGAEGSPLLVWQVAGLTDAVDRWLPSNAAHGVICPVSEAWRFPMQPTICPGIRLLSDHRNGHRHAATPAKAMQAGVSWAVVGRPIWGAAEPAVAALSYLQELR